MAKKYGGVSGEMLRLIVNKIEKLEEEKKEISEYLSDTYKEAKSQGFDVKVLRQLIKIRKSDQSELAEQEEVLDLYKHALGMADGDAKESEAEEEGEEERVERADKESGERYAQQFAAA